MAELPTQQEVSDLIASKGIARDVRPTNAPQYCGLCNGVFAPRRMTGHVSADGWGVFICETCDAMAMDAAHIAGMRKAVSQHHAGKLDTAKVREAIAAYRGTTCVMVDGRLEVIDMTRGHIYTHASGKDPFGEEDKSSGKLDVGKVREAVANHGSCRIGPLDPAKLCEALNQARAGGYVVVRDDQAIEITDTTRPPTSGFQELVKTTREDIIIEPGASPDVLKAVKFLGECDYILSLDDDADDCHNVGNAD